MFSRARGKSLNPPAVADIWHLVWHAPFDGSSDKYCTDFKCPECYDLVEDADTTVCEDHVCTKDVCCEPRGETVEENASNDKYFSLDTFNDVILPPIDDVPSSTQCR